MLAANDNRPLFQLTVSEFKNLLSDSIPEKKTDPQPTEPIREKINGIRGLAKFLDVSVPMIISAKVSHHYGKVSHLQKLGGFVCKCSNII